jgi:hypothetical protein
MVVSHPIGRAGLHCRKGVYAADRSPKAGNLLGLLPYSPYTSAAGFYAQRPHLGTPALQAHQDGESMASFSAFMRPDVPSASISTLPHYSSWMKSP